MKRIICMLLLVSGLLISCDSPATVAPVTEVATTASTEAPIAASAATQEVVHLKIGYQAFVSSSPIFIGVDDGYFAEQGLEVELVRFTTGGDILTALLAGEIDLTSENLSAGTISAVSQSDDLRIVAEKGFIDPVNTCDYQVIMARDDLLKDGSINNPESVKGLKFVTTPATIFEYGLEVQLGKLGLQASDIEFIGMPAQPDRLEALKNDAIDVVTFTEPWITRTRQSGAGDVWVSFSELTPNFPIGVIIYGPKLMSDSDLGNRFMTGYLSAVRQYNEGVTDHNAEIISKYTELPVEDVKSICLPSFSADGSTHLDTWITYQEWLVSKSYLDAVVPTDKLWDSQFIDFANNALK